MPLFHNGNGKHLLLQASIPGSANGDLPLHVIILARGESRENLTTGAVTTILPALILLAEAHIKRNKDGSRFTASGLSEPST